MTPSRAAVTLCPTGAMFGKCDARSGRSIERSWVYRCEAGVEDGRSGVDVGGSLLTCNRGSRRVFVVAGDSSCLDLPLTTQSGLRPPHVTTSRDNASDTS